MPWPAGGESPTCRSQFLYSFSKNSQAEQEINTPPGTFRSRSFTRLTMRVGLPHFGQSVLLEVSIIFLRSAVLAIFIQSLLDDPHTCERRIHSMQFRVYKASGIRRGAGMCCMSSACR